MIGSSNYVENIAPAIIINDDSSSNNIHNRPTLTLYSDGHNDNFLASDNSPIEYVDASDQINGNFLCLSNNIINLDDIPIEALRLKTKDLLSKRLNPIKVILSENGSPRDWRGVLNGIGLSDDITMVQHKPDEMKAVLDRWWDIHRDKATIGTLQKILGYIDRWDVVDDANDDFFEDAKIYLDSKKQKKEQHRIIDTSVKPYSDSKECPKDEDYELLTHDDAIRRQNGLPPQRYHAYVLFDENDIDLATEILTKMETVYGLKLCTKERDLFGGTIESDTIMKLISDRCERLIVIFSNAFFDGLHNTFFVKFAQALGIEQRKRKIIPCVLEGCQLPPSLAIYYPLRYKFTQHYNFWTKLYQSIHEVPENRIAPSHAIMPRITITEIDSTSTVQTIDQSQPQAAIQCKNDLDSPKAPKRRDKSKSPKSSSPNTPTSLKKLWNNLPKIGSQSTISSSMWTLGTDQITFDKENECCQSSLSLNNSISSPTPTKYKKTKWFKKFLSPSSAYKLSVESDSSVGTDNSTKKKKWYRKRFRSRSKSREPTAAHEI